MPAPDRYWFATLRKRRHRIVGLLLPGLMAWALAAPACATLRAEALVTAEPAAVLGGDAHVPHHAHATQPAAVGHAHAPDTDASAKCPHCATEHTAAVVHTCGVSGDAATLNTAPQSPSFDAKLVPLASSWLLPPRSTAAPPLIALATLETRPRAEPVPRNLRHCIFLV